MHAHCEDCGTLTLVCVICYACPLCHDDSGDFMFIVEPISGGKPIEYEVVNGDLVGPVPHA